MDIVLYDRDDSISLMRRDGGYEVLPVESVYGVIQVKSRLTKAVLQSGLENIASFKTLTKVQEPTGGIVVINTAKSTQGLASCSLTIPTSTGVS